MVKGMNKESAPQAGFSSGASNLHTCTLTTSGCGCAVSFGEGKILATPSQFYACSEQAEDLQSQIPQIRPSNCYKIQEGQAPE